MLFDIDGFALESICQDSAFNDQGYLSHMAQQNNVPLHDLGLRFNFIGSAIKHYGLGKDIFEKVFVFHLTSALSADERMRAAQHIDNAYKDMIKV